MSILTRINSIATQQVDRIKKAYKQHDKMLLAQARRQVALAKTKTAKEKVRLQLESDRVRLKTELAEAREATYKAKVRAQQAVKAANKARIEAGDLTIGERLSSQISAFTAGLAARQRARPRRRTVKRVTAKRIRSKR